MVVPIGRNIPMRPFGHFVLGMLDGTTGATVIDTDFAAPDLSLLPGQAAAAGNLMNARSFYANCDLDQYDAAKSAPRFPVEVPVAAGLIQ